MPARHRLRLESLEGRDNPTTFVVANTNDSGPGSLRQAILDANATDEADEIVFDRSFDAPHTSHKITLTTGEMRITRDLTLTGPTVNRLVISAEWASGVFVVDDGDAGTNLVVGISELAISYGSVPGAGGGILNREALTLYRVGIQSCVAGGNGGGIYNAGDLTMLYSDVGSSSATTAGGGVYNAGTLTMIGASLFGNQAGVGGGLYNAGNATLSAATLSSNIAIYTAGVGGGVYNTGTLTLTESTLYANVAYSAGGGVYNAGIAIVGGSRVSQNSTSIDGRGGGLYNTGALGVLNSTLDRNVARNLGGGGVYNEGVASLTQSTLAYNRTAGTDGVSDVGDGGGVLNAGTLTLAQSTVAANTAAAGGGVYNDAGDLDLVNTILAENTGGDYGGSAPYLDGVNLVQDRSLTGPDVINEAALLGPLQHNGGPTQTMLPAPGSYARNAGRFTAIPADALDADGDGDAEEPLPFDQRGPGFPRAIGGRVDLGAAQAPPAVAALRVNRGQAQRSIIRQLEIVLDDAPASSLLAAGRVGLIRHDLNGNNPKPVPLAGWMFSASGNTLRVSFGPQGLGGNRHSAASDGYYTLELDLDGDGVRETRRSFYRLLGDTDGDRRVDQADVDRIADAIANRYFAPDLDVNGDGVVNSSDLHLARRHRGRVLSPGLPLDG